PEMQVRQVPVTTLEKALTSQPKLKFQVCILDEWKNSLDAARWAAVAERQLKWLPPPGWTTANHNMIWRKRS
ncbi:MAG: hypothetical protein ACNA8H_03115, partial [Anaerolineales bacterium]